MTEILSINANGVDVDMVDLTDARVRLSLLETSSVELRFLDEGFTLLDSTSFAIGSTLVVKLLSETTETTVFDGEVVALGLEHSVRGLPITVVEGLDRSHRLSSVVNPTTYLNQTTSAIVGSIAGQHGLSAEVTTTETMHEYVLKTTNDRRFLDALADEVGFEWFVRGDLLTFRPRPALGTPAISLSWNGTPSLLRLGVRASGIDGASAVEVRGWDPATSTEIVGRNSATTADPELIGANATLATDAYRIGAATFGGTLTVSPGVSFDQAEALQRAKVITADLQSSTLRLSGESEPSALITPGTWLAIAECGTKLSGTYYVTDVEHIWGVDQPLVTRFHLGGRRSAGLSGSASAPVDFGQVGLVIGVVTSIKEDPKNMHRIKVRYPTLPSVESAWARVVTLGGENQSGMEARPEVDDEVLVGFEHGDLRRPFVIGGLLSKTDSYRTGAVNSDGSLNKRGIRTRGGNKLEMFDGDTRSATTGRYIAIVGADAATEIRLGDESMSMKTKNGNPITIESGTAKITLDNGRITITGDSIELKATQAFKVQGNTVDLKSNTAVGVDAGTTMKLQGTMVNVAASGVAEIKGSLLKLN